MEKKIILIALLFSTLILKAQAQGNVLSGDISFPSTSKLERYLNFNLLYTHDYISNTGGVKAGPRNIGALEISLATDLRKYTSINGEFLAHYLHINSHDNRAEIGDMQYVSNIDSPTQVDRMADLWYQHHFGKKLKILAGFHDISTDFNVTESAVNFLNSSFFISSEFVYAGPNGASVYPITAVGARAVYQLTNEIEILTGAYDADPGGEETYRSFHSRISNNEGYLLITEIDHILENQKIGLAA